MVEEVLLELQKYGINDVSIFKPTFKKEISSYLNQHSKRFELLVLFGGDGTLNEAINGIMSSNNKFKMLYIPTGTTNDVGNYLKIPKDFKEALKLLHTKPVSIDICKVNEMYFLYVLACGKFCDISFGSNTSNNKKRFGRLVYYYRAIRVFLENKKETLEIDNKKYSLFLALNVYRIAGFKIRKKVNKLNDGIIDVVFFRNATFFNTIAIGLFLVFGIKLKHLVEIHSGNSFEIKCKNKEQFNTDGEESYFTNHVLISVVKEVIDMYIPLESIKKFL